MGDCNFSTGFDSTSGCGGNPVVVSGALYMYKLSDWNANKDAGLVTVSSTSPNEGQITNISNATGVQAYKFDLASTNPALTTEPQIGDSEKGFTVGVSFFLPSMNQEQRNQWSCFNVCDTRIVVIPAYLNTDDFGGDVYGNENGLVVTGFSYVSKGTQGNGYMISLATSEKGASEKQLAPTVWAGDGTATLNMLDSLTTVGP